jgi:hypothetical protein
MRGRGRLAAISAVAFVAFTASACARSPGQGSAQPPPVSSSSSSASSTPTPTDQEHLQARALLDRWADAVAAAGGPPWFYVSPGFESRPIGDWENGDFGGNAKIALLAGSLVAAAQLSDATPPPGEVRWADGVTRSLPLMSANDALEALKAGGNHQCGDCQPLTVTGATLSAADVTTSRGQATVPVWEFALQGTAVRVMRVAVAPSATPMLTSKAGVGMRVESATGIRAGRELTVTVAGSPGPASQPCGADYTGEAVESDLGVVVIVHEHRYAPDPNASPIACAAIGAMRTVTVQLASPLGDRAVLDPSEGLPVSVTLSS